MPQRRQQPAPIRSALVMGLGRHGGGVAAARFLAHQGARVLVSDAAEADSLQESIAALVDLPQVRFRFGGHDERDFASAQCVVVNPAVRPSHPCLAVARRGGAHITSEIELFLQRCRAPIVGVTGSNGKSSTATMIAEILTAAGRRAWLGGNIGVSLLPSLAAIESSDRVVLELSSFQLAHLSENCPLPQVAVVINCAANHLDWHVTYENYRAAKQRLLTGQTAECAAVLNLADPETATWRGLVRGRLVAPWSLSEIPPLQVAGEHQRVNAACAAAAAEATAPESRSVASAALAKFAGLEHRLQRLPDVGGRRFYNDSKSTTPEATVAALQAIAGPVWLLLGGVDKGVSFTALCAAASEHCRAVGLYGAARGKIEQTMLLTTTERPALSVAETMPGALAWC